MEVSVSSWCIVSAVPSSSCSSGIGSLSWDTVLPWSCSNVIFPWSHSLLWVPHLPTSRYLLHHGPPGMQGLTMGCRGFFALVPGVPPLSHSSSIHSCFSHISSQFSPRRCFLAVFALSEIHYPRITTTITNRLGLQWHVCLGARWHWFRQTQGSCLTSSQRSHLCSSHCHQNFAMGTQCIWTAYQVTACMEDVPCLWLIIGFSWIFPFLQHDLFEKREYEQYSVQDMDEPQTLQTYTLFFYSFLLFFYKFLALDTFWLLLR